MDFLIADTFTDSLSRLTGDEQKAVKTTAFALQMNPASSGGTGSIPVPPTNKALRFGSLAVVFQPGFPD